MAPSDRALATFYRLSIETMSASAAVWPQFSMQRFNPLVAVCQKRSDLLATAGLFVNLLSAVAMAVSFSALRLSLFLYVARS